MSIQFNDLDLRKGLVQFYEQETNREFGEISGSSNRLKDFAANVNLALDDLFTIGFTKSGTWQLDDAGHEEFPIVRADIVSGQQNYTFLKDEQGNFLLNFHRVIVTDPDGRETIATPRDVQRDNDIDSFLNSNDGIPSEYDKTGNGIFFNNIPNYNMVNGIKIYVDREPLYFKYSDTDKFAGIPGNLHEYLFIHPAEAYARRKGLDNYGALVNKKAELVRTIKEQFSLRSTKDERPRMRPLIQNNK